MDGQISGRLPAVNPHDCTFVGQHEVLEPTMTVSEVLSFYADLRLPPTMSSTEKLEIIQNVLQKLGMSWAANTLVGGTSVLVSTKTLSGRRDEACKYWSLFGFVPDSALHGRTYLGA